MTQYTVMFTVVTIADGPREAARNALASLKAGDSFEASYIVIETQVEEAQFADSGIVGSL